MERKAITIRIQDELIDRLDDEAEEKGVSRSEYVRGILEGRHRADEVEEKVERLQNRLEQREDRIGTLEEELARRSQMENKIDELALEVRETQQSPPFFVKWYRWWQNR